MRRYFYIARFTLQTKSGLSITTGDNDFENDSELARDANGLPTIPGTSLAGVLSHLLRTENPNEQTHQRIFGFTSQREEGQATEIEKGSEASSNLQVENALLQTSEGKVYDQLENVDTIKTDPLTAALYDSILLPFQNQHVRLTDHGTSDPNQRGLFDRAYVPAGCRFSCELSYWAENAENGLHDWQATLQLLHHPLLKLGGATRAGYGELELLAGSLRTGEYDLKDSTQAQAFRNLNVSLNNTSGLTRVDTNYKPASQVLTATGGGHTAGLKQIVLPLQPRHFWLVGGGDQALDINKQSEHDPDILPRMEVVWHRFNQAKDGKFGEWQHKLCLPGSAIKGCLRHRCNFHFRRLNEIWHSSKIIDQESLLAPWFGIERSSDGDSNLGNAGRVFFHNVYLDIPEEKYLHAQMHNVIDRFTGGVRNDRGQLFEEVLVYQQGFDIRIYYDPSKDTTETKFEEALDLTLQDLANGALALGARSHGFMQLREGRVLQRLSDNQEPPILAAGGAA